MWNSASTPWGGSVGRGVSGVPDRKGFETVWLALRTSMASFGARRSQRRLVNGGWGGGGMWRGTWAAVGGLERGGRRGVGGRRAAAQHQAYVHQLMQLALLVEAYLPSLQRMQGMEGGRE